MLNNVGLPGIMVFVLIVGLPVWLISRSRKRKAREQERIAEALERIAASVDGDSKTQ